MGLGSCLHDINQTWVILGKKVLEHIIIIIIGCKCVWNMNIQL